MPRPMPGHPYLLSGLLFLNYMAAIAAPTHPLFKKRMSQKRKTGVWSTGLGFTPHFAWIRDLVFESHSRDKLVKKQGRNCFVASRRPVARIESKDPHSSYEMDWTPHGDPQHPVQQCVRLRVLPRALLRPPGRPRRPRGLGPGNRILKNYLSFSFSRAVFLTERDVDQTAPSNLPLVFDDVRCLFNTGPHTRRYETTYGLFEPNTKPDAHQHWFLKGSFKESDPMLVSFEYLPCRVRFAEDPSELVFDHRLPIRSNIDHILGDEENLTRIPASLMGEGSSLLLRRAFEGAVVEAARRAAANYTLAVPQFYGGRIQLLLPLCLTGDKPELALTIQREDGFCAARTCLTLDMAYNNARLICRPETSWIKR